MGYLLWDSSQKTETVQSDRDGSWRFPWLRSASYQHIYTNDIKNIWTKSGHSQKDKSRPNVSKIFHGRRSWIDTVVNQPTSSQQVEVNVTLKPSYNSRLPITTAKYQDLIRLCDNWTVPKSFRNENRDLPRQTDEEDEDD